MNLKPGDQESTDFGYKQVSIGDKQHQVNRVFDSVAKRYDLMNHLMSFGLHVLWKHQAVKALDLETHHRVLDLAGGTADLSGLISKHLVTGQVILADINESMIQVGRDRMIDSARPTIEYCLCNGESLPFPEECFERCIIAFGLRNITRKESALSELNRVLKPKGKLIVLEFSELQCKPLRKAYDWYSFSILPRLGQLIVNDSASYQYLAESIRRHPNQETLKTMLQQAGFIDIQYRNLLQGIVALHSAYKI